MGLFSNVLGGDTAPVKLTKQESFLGILLSAVAADGHISDEEVEDFRAIAFKSNILREMSSSEYTHSIDKLFKILRRDGAQALVDLSVPNLPTELRLGTFTIACDLLFSDGSIEREEEQILEQIKSKLGIDDVSAMKSVEVISLKNKV